MPVHLQVDSQCSAVRVRENTLGSVWRAVTLQEFAQNAKLRKFFIAEAASQSENGYISASAKFNTSVEEGKAQEEEVGVGFECAPSAPLRLG